METRICTKCGLEKPLTKEYFPHKSGENSPFRSDCKECVNNKQRRLYADHPKTGRENAEKQRQKLKERGVYIEKIRAWNESCALKRGLTYREWIREQSKQRAIREGREYKSREERRQARISKKNKLRLCVYCNQYFPKEEMINHKTCEQCIEKYESEKESKHKLHVDRQCKREMERYYSEPKYRLNRRLRNAIGKHLRGEKCGRHWFDLVGWNLDDLIKHISKQLKPPMTWGNYGYVWHIDHKIPISRFNYQYPEDIDFKRAWALKNLQPLLAAVNKSKSNKLTKPFQPSLCISI